MLWCSHGWIILRFWASFSLLLSLEYLCWTSAYIDHFVYLLLYLLRLMLTTSAGHLFKSVSQEHQTKSWGDIFIDCIISVLYLPCLPRIHLHFVLLFWEIALFLLNLLLPSHTYFQEKNHCQYYTWRLLCRYCREPNAKPLWALSSGCPSNADIPSCSSCKGPLCYEFQVGQIYSLRPVDHSPFFITVIYPISHSLTTATIDVLILFCVYIQYHQIKS